MNNRPHFTGLWLTDPVDLQASLRTERPLWPITLLFLSDVYVVRSDLTPTDEPGKDFAIEYFVMSYELDGDQITMEAVSQPDQQPTIARWRSTEDGRLEFKETNGTFRYLPVTIEEAEAAGFAAPYFQIWLEQAQKLGWEYTAVHSSPRG